jgi:hypothetical protein
MTERMRHANQYELSDEEVQVTSSSSGIDGRPHFTFDDGSESRSFSGDEIRSSPSELGTTLTLTLEAVPDGYTRTLTVIIPDANLAEESAECTAVAIDSTIRTSIGGPDLVKGAVQSYLARTLRGTASFVEF